MEELRLQGDWYKDRFQATTAPMNNYKKEPCGRVGELFFH